MSVRDKSVPLGPVLKTLRTSSLLYSRSVVICVWFQHRSIAKAILNYTVVIGVGPLHRYTAKAILNYTVLACKITLYSTGSGYLHGYKVMAANTHKSSQRSHRHSYVSQPMTAIHYVSAVPAQGWETLPSNLITNDYHCLWTPCVSAPDNEDRYVPLSEQTKE